jgi:hypothetical protein
MIKNLIHNTNPIIFHAQGKPFFCPLWDKIKNMSNTHKSIPEKLKIITFNNGHSYLNKPAGSLEWSVQNQCEVLGKDITIWKNILKIDLTIKFLENTNAEYILATDSCDVVVYSLDRIIEKFLSKNCDMLFNAEFNPYPNNNFANVEKSFFKPPFQHLNAGAWIGKREFVLNFFRELSKEVSDNIISDQGVIRNNYLKYYPQILLDDTCSIFQTLNSVDQNILADQII